MEVSEHRVAVVHSNIWNNNHFVLWYSWISHDLLIAVRCQKHSNRELWFQSGWFGCRCFVLVRRIAHVLLPTLVDIQISNVLSCLHFNLQGQIKQIVELFHKIVLIYFEPCSLLGFVFLSVWVTRSVLERFSISTIYCLKLVARINRK